MFSSPNLYLTPMHAGCVARKGRGVLLCGASGAGKSCLAYACVRGGWTYVTDDACSLLRHSSEPVVLGRPHQIRFRPDAEALFPELKGRLAATHPNGKPTIEIRTADLPNIALAFCARVASVVFLNRRPSANRPRLLPVPSRDAAARIEDDLPLLGEEVSAEHRRSVRNLFESGVAAFDLYYVDPFPVANCLEALL